MYNVLLSSTNIEYIKKLISKLSHNIQNIKITNITTNEEETIFTIISGKVDIIIIDLETSVFAASSTETDYSTAKVIAYNSGIASASYVGFNSYSFTGSGRSSTINVDGTYMAYEYNITNSNSSYVTIETVVDGRVVQTNNVSGSEKIDWIPMGSSTI